MLNMLPLKNLKIQEVKEENNPHDSIFIFRYLPPTMGLTMGNCLRRVLLTSIAGVAPIGLEITDKNGPVKSKFTTLSGITETTPYLILNCKKIVLEVKEHKGELYCLEMEINNSADADYTITASDFQKNSAVEVKNPTLYLATLAPFSYLKMKLYCREDYGYHSVAEQKKYLLEKENVIVVDTDYSPVKGGNVNFQVNSVVTGLEKDEEELKLTIITAGAISPKKALREALSIIEQVSNTIREKLK